MDIKTQKHLGTSKSIVPFEISSVIVHEGGDDFLVLEINGEWMFRFSRNEVSRKALRIENGFLAQLKTISPLPVPDHKYRGDDFVGYPKITGTLLDIDVFQSLSKKSLARIAQQMGQFLSAVHNFPMDKARRIGVTEGWSGYHQQAIHRFKDEIAPTPSNQSLRDQWMQLQVCERVRDLDGSGIQPVGHLPSIACQVPGVKFRSASYSFFPKPASRARTIAWARSAT